MPYVDIDNELRMHYEDDDFSPPWEDSEVILMHHGNAKNSKFWYGWIPVLSSKYRVIRVDGRGFGQSTVPSEGYKWSLEQFANDSKNLLDELGISKVHFIGETIGGSIGLVFAHMFPDMTQSLTLCTSPYNFAAVKTYSEYRDLVLQKGVRTWVELTSSQRLPADRTKHNAWYIDQMSNTSKQVVVETLSYLSRVDLTPILPEIKTPTLILVGGQSLMNTDGRVRSLQQLLVNSVIKELEGASGYVQHSEPAMCAEAWLDFASEIVNN